MNYNHKFEDYDLSPEILSAVSLMGYKEPTAIQAEVIPQALAGKNIRVKAQTGTGKTAAFAIPICEKVCWDKNLPQALVLEPTRELAEQVKDEIFYIGRKKRLKVPAVFGGFPIDKQIQTLKQKTHIVVGTPGRVEDHLRRGSLKLEQVRHVVIDEADLMMDMGFAEEVEKILSMVPAGAQMLLFSATLGEKAEQLAENYMEDSLSIVREEETKGQIVHMVYETEPEEKYNVFRNILIQENPDHCMIFCGTREMVHVLFRKLRRDRIFCGMLHGELEQKERMKTVDAFRRGAFRFLIATDVAARGIDFDDISHVINYDFPTGRETYVHRAGRTGRNGKSGKAVSLVCEEDQRMRRMVETYMEMSLPVLEIPVLETADEKSFWEKQRVKAAPKVRKGAALNQDITRLVIGGGRKSKMRAVDIVGTICSIAGMNADDIGIIDVRDSQTYVEIRNGKGMTAAEALREKTIKGKIRKITVRN